MAGQELTEQTVEFDSPPPDAPPPDGPVSEVPPGAGPRRGRGGWWAAFATRSVIGLVSLLILGCTGFAWAEYHNLNLGIKKSDVLNAADGGAVTKSLNGDFNILVMGLDSRLDENGDPLPQAMYDALHAGDADVGGHNANVLMLLHVPANGGRATAVSIPRDDYVSFPDAPDGYTHGKIKEAYGYAYIQEYNKLTAQGVTDHTTLEQSSRDAGRRAEIDTVGQFLGGVPIDHFVEVTMAAFLEIAQAVQPITVCLLDRTQDTYSGANFQPGVQQLNANQAVAFVRQRRDNVYGDPNYNDFTDLDRERRQQAFIVSLAYQLKQAGTFADPSKMSQIMEVAKDNIAIDSHLDILTFVQEATSLTDGKLTFYTLPIKGFSSDGSYNIVDLKQVQTVARQLLVDSPGGSSTSGTPTVTPTPTTAPLGAGSTTVDVVNDAGIGGIASTVENALAANGYRRGTATSDASTLRHSVIYYPAGGQPAASVLAGMLDIATIELAPSVPAGHLRIDLGTDFRLPSRLAAAGQTGSTTSTGATGSERYGTTKNGTGRNGTTTTPTTVDTSGLDSVNGGTVPCVR